MLKHGLRKSCNRKIYVLIRMAILNMELFQCMHKVFKCILRDYILLNEWFRLGGLWLHLWAQGEFSTLGVHVYFPLNVLAHNLCWNQELLEGWGCVYAQSAQDTVGFQVDMVSWWTGITDQVDCRTLKLCQQVAALPIFPFRKNCNKIVVCFYFY